MLGVSQSTIPRVIRPGRLRPDQTTQAAIAGLTLEEEQRPLKDDGSRRVC